jgi:glycosyltransferase involved in cell wall biosynthesis
MRNYSRRFFLFTHRPNGVYEQKFYRTLNKHFSVSLLLPESNNPENSVYLITLGKNLSSFLKLFKLTLASTARVGQGIKIVDVIDSGFFPSPIEKKVVLLFGTPMHPEMQWLRYPKFAVKYVKFAQDLLIKKAQLVIAYNEMMGEYCEEVGAHEVIMCPNYPLKNFKPATSKNAFIASSKIPKNTKIALFVAGGRMLEIYGLELLTKAWSLVEKKLRDVCLVIVGPAPTFWIKQSVEKLGIKHLFVVSPVPYSSLPNWINVADVCLAPRTPGFPVEFYNDKDSTKINEYAALSKPIVACGYSPSPRYLVVPQTPHGLAEGILKAFAGEVRPATPHYWEENESLIIDTITKIFNGS